MIHAPPSFTTHYTRSLALRADYSRRPPSPQHQAPCQHQCYRRRGSRIFVSSQLSPCSRTPKEAYIILRINKVPPVLAAERILQRLTSRVDPCSVASIEIRVLRPRHVHLGVIVVLHTVGSLCIACLDLIRREGVLDIAPCQVVVAAMSGQKRTRWSPHVTTVARVDDDHTFPVTLEYVSRDETDTLQCINLLVMTGLNACENRTILLIKKIVYNANLGVIAALIGIVHGKCWSLIPNSHPGIPAVAANIGILALRGCRGSMGCIVGIRRGRRSAKSPGRVAGWFV